ncbi:unnamed protein product, partial [Closterium sp. NIES-65]
MRHSSFKPRETRRVLSRALRRLKIRFRLTRPGAGAILPLSASTRGSPPPFPHSRVDPCHSVREFLPVAPRSLIPAAFALSSHFPPPHLMLPPLPLR